MLTLYYRFGYYMRNTALNFFLHFCLVSISGVVLLTLEKPDSRRAPPGAVARKLKHQAKPFDVRGSSVKETRRGGTFVTKT